MNIKWIFELIKAIIQTSSNVLLTKNSLPNSKSIRNNLNYSIE